MHNFVLYSRSVIGENSLKYKYVSKLIICFNTKIFLRMENSNGVRFPSSAMVTRPNLFLSKFEYFLYVRKVTWFLFQSNFKVHIIANMCACICNSIITKLFPLP